MLLVVGYFQSKKRAVNVYAVFMLPIAMIAFSFFGVLSIADAFPLAISAWLVGMTISLLVGVKLAHPKHVAFSEKEHTLRIPGSWTPLLLMMGIFFIKYFVGFATARELAIIDDQLFTVVVSLLYGTFTGVFLSRSMIMFKASKINN